MTNNNQKNMTMATFWERFLASWIDHLLIVVLFLAFFYSATHQEILAQTVYIFFVYLLVQCNPAIVLLYDLMTYYVGGSPGKLLTGLRVVNAEGKHLSFYRVIFRQTIGYTFSWIFFGLGYLSMFKDEKNQTWHDKTVDSFVIRQQTLWPVGLLTLFILFGVCGYLAVDSVRTFSNGPLIKEFETYQQRMDAEAKQNTEDSYMKPLPVEDKYESVSELDAR